MEGRDKILIKQAIDHIVVEISNSIVKSTDDKTKENLRELNKEYYRIIVELDAELTKKEK